MTSIRKKMGAEHTEAKARKPKWVAKQRTKGCGATPFQAMLRGAAKRKGDGHVRA